MSNADSESLLAILQSSKKGWQKEHPRSRYEEEKRRFSLQSLRTVASMPVHACVSLFLNPHLRMRGQVLVELNALIHHELEPQRPLYGVEKLLGSVEAC